MNPIVARMFTRENPYMAMMQPLYNAMQTAKDPMSALGQMAMNDERMQQVIQTINQYGGVQNAVYAVAQQQNRSPNDVLNQARSMMQTFRMK